MGTKDSEGLRKGVPGRGRKAVRCQTKGSWLGTLESGFCCRKRGLETLALIFSHIITAEEEWQTRS